jgi:hypothetical protein
VARPTELQPRPRLSSPPTAPEDQPAARQPTLEAPARPRPEPQTTAPEIVAKPGDLICAVCGTPNDPTRRFCRRCGNSLAAAAAAPKPLPWWRRLLAPKPKASAAAGERPKGLGEAGQPRAGVIGRLAPVVLIAIVAFGLTSYLVVPSARSLVNGTIDDLRLRFFAQIVDVHPVAATGAAAGGTNVRALIDDNTNTFWLGDPTSGPPAATITIGSTIDLGGLVIHSGSSTQSDYTKHRRPETIELSFPGTTLAPVTVPLQDTPNPQPVALDVRDIQTVVVTVTKWYESAAGGDHLVAIREIEFKAKQ